MKNLYIDFDGVLMDTIATSYKLLEEQNIDKNNYDEMLKFYQTLDWPAIIEVTPILNDSMNRLKRIKESNLFHISILTHVNSLPEIVAKVKFIRKYFHDIPIIACPKQLSKAQMVHARDAILIDDWHVNLEEWKDAGGIGIHFSLTFEDKGFPCIDKIDEILKMNL